ncbi:TetR/AcrR family transcriptional regulator [Nocardia sp. NPDC050175]|uniref:TetR/AcrR family transcriptional regulator n=1 Tax=Nocardia sp. NPDC050175 TaxID=3364317 RepID=UPI0037A5CB5D
MDEPIGRRERKKAQTRTSLADAALRLFLEHGYDRVSVKDVAEAADVSVTTLFKHFPSKEALLFDLDEDLEAGLVAAVRDRAPGQSIPQALREHILLRANKVRAETAQTAAFTRMIADTPVLREYARRMWLRHETVLAEAIAADIGAVSDDISCAALARFALDASGLIERHPDPSHAANEVFALLENGWNTAHSVR